MGEDGQAVMASEARAAWMDHLHECRACPVNLCDKGDELASAVRQTLAPGEKWEWA
jgi:hypothetical protein